MNEQEVAWLLVKAAPGEDFFATLCRNPKEAAEALGLSLSDKEAAIIREYAEGMRERAERGGVHILSYPLPYLSGPPDDEDTSRRATKS